MVRATWMQRASGVSSESGAGAAAKLPPTDWALFTAQNQFQRRSHCGLHSAASEHTYGVDQARREATRERRRAARSSRWSAVDRPHAGLPFTVDVTFGCAGDGACCDHVGRAAGGGICGAAATGAARYGWPFTFLRGALGGARISSFHSVRSAHSRPAHRSDVDRFRTEPMSVAAGPDTDSWSAC